MPARFWIRTVALLGAAYLFSLVSLLLAGDIDGDFRDVAVTVAQWMTFAAVTTAVVWTVVVARPFAAPHRRSGLTITLAPVAAVVSAAVLALSGVEVGLGLVWLGLLTVLGAIACATARHGSSTAVAAAGLGWWLVCGGFVAYACGDSLLHPTHAIDGNGFADSGNSLSVYLGLVAFAMLTTLTAALQFVVLAVGQARRRRATPPA